MRKALWAEAGTVALYVHGGVSGRARKEVALGGTLSHGSATALDAVEAAVAPSSPIPT